MEIFKIEETKSIPITLMLSSNTEIKAIAYGFSHFILCTSDNEIIGYGSNTNGQLGNDHSLMNNEFSKVVGNWKMIEKITCGTSSSFFMNNENEIYYSGFLTKELFVKKFTKLEHCICDKIKWIRGGYNLLIVVTLSDNIYVIGQNNLYLQNNYKEEEFNVIDNNLNLMDLQCGNNHVIILDKYGDIYGIGSNGSGQMGLGDEQKKITEITKVNLSFKVKKISCFSSGTLIINEFDELYGTGCNIDGCLGLGYNSEDVTTFTKVMLTIPHIKSVFSSFCYYNIVRTKDNNLYFTGLSGNRSNKIFESKNCKEYLDDIYPVYYLDSFTKLNFNLQKKHVNLLLLQGGLFAILTDYKISK